MRTRQRLAELFLARNPTFHLKRIHKMVEKITLVWKAIINRQQSLFGADRRTTTLIQDHFVLSLDKDRRDARERPMTRIVHAHEGSRSTIRRPTRPKISLSDPAMT